MPGEVKQRIAPGVAVLPKGLWSRHTLNGQTANALAPDTLTDLGGGACFNDARVQVERCAGVAVAGRVFLREYWAGIEPLPALAVHPFARSRSGPTAPGS